MLANFRCVSVREQAVGTKVFVHLNEMEFALGFLAGARSTGLAIAHDSTARCYPSCLDKGPKP